MWYEERLRARQCGRTDRAGCAEGGVGVASGDRFRCWHVGGWWDNPWCRELVRML